MLKLKLQYFGWCKELTHWKRPWCWERLKVGEEDDRGWDGWMASPTWWTWVWASSRGWWWTGKHGMLQSLGSQRVGHDWWTELNWTWHSANYADGALLPVQSPEQRIAPPALNGFKDREGSNFALQKHKIYWPQSKKISLQLWEGRFGERKSPWRKGWLLKSHQKVTSHLTRQVLLAFPWCRRRGYPWSQQAQKKILRLETWVKQGHIVRPWETKEYDPTK